MQIQGEGGESSARANGANNSSLQAVTRNGGKPPIMQVSIQSMKFKDAAVSTKSQRSKEQLSQRRRSSVSSKQNLSISGQKTLLAQSGSGDIEDKLRPATMQFKMVGTLATSMPAQTPPLQPNKDGKTVKARQEMMDQRAVLLSQMCNATNTGDGASTGPRLIPKSKQSAQTMQNYQTIPAASMTLAHIAAIQNSKEIQQKSSNKLLSPALSIDSSQISNQYQASHKVHAKKSQRVNLRSNNRKKSMKNSVADQNATSRTNLASQRYSTMPQSESKAQTEKRANQMKIKTSQFNESGQGMLVGNSIASSFTNRTNPQRILSATKPQSTDRTQMSVEETSATGLMINGATSQSSQRQTVFQIQGSELKQMTSLVGNNNLQYRQATIDAQRPHHTLTSIPTTELNQQIQQQQQALFQDSKLPTTYQETEQQLVQQYINTLQEQQQHQMIIQQQQHRQSSSNQSLPGMAQSRQNASGEDYFVLDNQNRVILVSSAGVHPNTAAQAQYVNQSHHQKTQNSCREASGRGSAGHKQRSNTRGSGNENVNGSQVRVTGHKAATTVQQQRIIEQLSGKTNSAKSKPGSKAAQALKENNQFHRQEIPQNAQEQLYQENHQDTRNDSVGACGNRNSNQNMKTAGTGVTRFGIHHGSTFSATQSTYNSIGQGNGQPTQTAPNKVIYQLDQNYNYVVQQVVQQNGMPVQHQNGVNTPGAKAPSRQTQINPGQRPQVSQQQPQQHIQQYYSNQQQQLISNAAVQYQQQQLQLHLQQSAQQHQQIGPTSSQKQMKSSSRPRPRSSAPVANVKNRRQREAATRIITQQELVGMNPAQQYEAAGQIFNENLMQTTGHIIVANVNGTPLNELQMPMIINQTQQSGSAQPKSNGQLCIAGIVHPDAVLVQQIQQQQKYGAGSNSQPSSKRRDGNMSQHANTQNGFFGKRKNRDTNNKTVVQSNNGTQGASNNPQGSSICSQKGLNVAISNPQQYIVTRDSYNSGNGSQRPLTGKQRAHTFSNTQASISMKSNEGHPQVMVNMLTESDSESASRLPRDQKTAIANSIQVNKRSSVQGNSQMNTDACTSSSQHGSNYVHQKNLSSVRSGQLINCTNPISQEQEQLQQNSKDFAPSKQQLGVTTDKARVLNQSASPSTKISIRGRKGMSSIIGNGGTAGATAGPGLQMLPSTPKNYKRTKRVLFARRMNLMDRPMLIITFQGVLGDFMKKPIQGLKEHNLVQQTSAPQTAKEKKAVAKEEDSVNLRAGVVDGLRYLSQHFQLIIFSRETLEDSWFEKQGGQQPAADVQTKAILNFLQQNPDIKLDGYYASVINAKSQTMTDDYSQIFVDFGLNSEQKVKEKVLFVTSIASDFICNQRLPANANISPKNKKPKPSELGISNARGLTDIDPKGFFMFDTACQPAQPLVKGLPISLDMKQHQQAANKLAGTRSSSIINDQQTDDSILETGTTVMGSIDTDVTIRHMPSTLLVPNLRTQNARSQTNFQHVLKSIMMLAFLGQKKANGKHLLKDNSMKDFSSELYELENEFGSIKEKNLKLTQTKLKITPQIFRGQTDVIPSTASGPHHLSASQKTSMQRRTRHQIGGVVNSGSMTISQHREAESPGSDLSGRNGSRTRILKNQGAKQVNGGLKIIGHTNTSSSRTAATAGHDGTSSGMHKNRSHSINSDKGLYQHGADHQLSQNDSCSNMGHDNQAQDNFMEQYHQRELCIDLQDPAFFQNLSWCAGVDYLNSKPMSVQKKFLGMQGANSDVVWRFYRKHALERIKLRQIYETKMQGAEQLIKKTLSNETIVSNQQKSIDCIFEILRSRDLVGNPFGFTMGRNYRFFSNLKVAMRRQMSRELEQWKARSEAAAALTSQKSKEVSKQEESKQTPTEATTAEEKELAEVTRLNSIIQSQQVLQQQQHEALESLLEQNQLINRFVVVGIDAPTTK